MGSVVDDNVINNINSIFDVENPFRQIKTIEERIAMLKKNSNYIVPMEIELGKRPDTAFDRKVGGYVPVLVAETFQYVPIIEVLELVLSSNEIRNCIHSEESSADGILGRSIDGECFKNHPFFSQ